MLYRPELKVERVSYDVPTPGALEGMLKSIYWKPSICYVIDEIVVFKEIEMANVRRNEVKDKVLLSAVKKSDERKRRRSVYLYIRKQKPTGGYDFKKCTVWSGISF